MHKFRFQLYFLSSSPLLVMHRVLFFGSLEWQSTVNTAPLPSIFLPTTCGVELDSQRFFFAPQNYVPHRPMAAGLVKGV